MSGFQQGGFQYTDGVYDVITWLTDHGYQDAAEAAEKELVELQDPR